MKRALAFLLLFASCAFAGLTNPGGGGGGTTNNYYSSVGVRVTDTGYNAVGNDSTDNTTAIQAAINAQATAGGAVIIPKGKFRFTHLTLPKNVSLVGEDQFASVLKGTASGAMITYTGTDAFDFNEHFVSLGAPMISNLTIDGNSVATDGIFFSEFDFAQLRDVLVKNCTGKAFRFEGAVNVRLDNCRAHYNGYGFYFKKVASSAVWGPGNPLPPNLAVLTNCAAMFNVTRGIHYQDGNGLFLNGCDIESNGTLGNSATGGVYVAADSNNGINGVVMNHCWVEANVGGSHLEIANAPYITLNSIRDTTFLDTSAGSLSHCIILGGGGAATNYLEITGSGAIPERHTSGQAKDIYGTGANSDLNLSPTTFFTTAGTIGNISGISAIFSDSFTGANGTGIASHTPDSDAHGGGWTSVTGAFQIQSNQLKATTTDCEAHFDTAQADGTYTVNVSIPAGGIGLLAFRQVSSNSVWYFLINKTSGTPTAVLQKYVSGVSTNVVGPTAITFPDNTMTTLKVILSGSSISCHIIDNGGDYTFASVTDSANLTGTIFGVYGSAVNTLFDNLSFTTP